MSNIRPRPYFRKCRPYAISLRHIFTPYQFIIFRFLKVLIFKFHYYQKLDLDIKQFTKLRKIKKTGFPELLNIRTLNIRTFGPFVRAKDERANARNVSFQTLYGGQFTLSTPQLLTLNYPFKNKGSLFLVNSPELVHQIINLLSYSLSLSAVKNSSLTGHGEKKEGNRYFIQLILKMASYLSFSFFMQVSLLHYLKLDTS